MIRLISLGSIGFWKDTDISNKKLTVEKMVLDSFFMVFEEMKMPIEFEHKFVLLQDNIYATYVLSYDENILKRFDKPLQESFNEWVLSSQNYISQNKSYLQSVCATYYKKKHTFEVIYNDIKNNKNLILKNK